ncbi:MAG: methyltransferase domain-containing protein [Nitrospirota bacterium]
MFTLDHIVPWGRSFDEYRRMFGLTDADLARTIVGCGDGPASFNAEATARGTRVVSCDPIYRWGPMQIRERIAATSETILAQTRKNAAEFVWGDEIGSVEKLGQIRRQAMDAFLEDFEAGKAAGRYVEAELPTLPFPDGAFDLAVCSHLLFLYTGQLGEAFHRAAIREMCRVASEVRIFPLLTLGGQRSPYVETGVAEFCGAGFAVTLERVSYEFQRGGNQMLRIRRAELTDG